MLDDLNVFAAVAQRAEPLPQVCVLLKLREASLEHDLILDILPIKPQLAHATKTLRLKRVGSASDQIWQAHTRGRRAVAHEFGCLEKVLGAGPKDTVDGDGMILASNVVEKRILLHASIEIE